MDAFLTFEITSQERNNTALMSEFFDLARAAIVANMPEVAFVGDHTVRRLIIVDHLIKHYSLSWSEIIRMMSKDVYVHPEYVEELGKADKESKSFLSKGFVQPDKLLHVINSVAQTTDVERLLAVDGLMGILTNEPNFELRNYLNNLKIPSGYKISHFVEEPDYRVRHVRAVRRMYTILKLAGIYGIRSRHVYAILRKIFKRPDMPGDEPQLPEDVVDRCIRVYKLLMNDRDIYYVAHDFKFHKENKISHVEDKLVPKIPKAPEGVVPDNKD